MVDNKACYLCGETKFNKRSGSVRDMPELDIFECTSCGLVFLLSSAPTIDGFYENSGMRNGKTPDPKLILDKTVWDDKRRFQYLKSELSNCKLLDFGCGTGGFLLRARDLAAMVFGVEPESRLKSHFQNNDLTVFKSLSDIPNDIRSKGCDIITIFHVLEHLPDPKSVLGELSKMLTSNGQVIIEVPNADDALLTLYKCEPFSNFTYWSCHLFLFTAKTLQMLFEQVGLKVNYIRQIQRYPLSNHLYWLANGEPGGHQKWHFLDSPELRAAYEKQLAAIGKCDMIMASVSNI